jgi:four helix bundle protein
MATINSFTDLIVWQKGHKFVLDIYKLTEDFPASENFGLTSQLRRAAVSVTSNITEGFERKSGKELVQFLALARGSLAEIQNQLVISRDIGYISNEQFDRFANQSIEIHKLLNGFIKSVRSRNQQTNDSRLATNHSKKRGF